MMPAVAILAGGLATRQYPATKTKPKALLEVAGRPFIFHQLELLRRNGVGRVVLCTGYLGEQIQAAVGNGSQWGLQVEYSFEGNRRLGTGGALRLALPLLGEAFFVLYGDTYLPIDFRAVHDYFQAKPALGLMTVLHNRNRWDQSNVAFANGQILRYEKEHPGPELEYIDYGLGLLRADAVAQEQAEVFDLSLVYRRLLENGQLLGYEVRERFYEIGTPLGLAETEDYLRGEADHANRLWPSSN
jgi:N-acetyl-alpha-D-muramate 1-phosphate uridylyltransferase